MSKWSTSARLALVAPMLAVGCGMIAPLEPLPDAGAFDPFGGSAGDDDESGGDASGMGGTSGTAGSANQGGTLAGRGGRTGGSGGSGGDASAGTAGGGASGGSAATGGKGGQGGTAGSGAEGGTGGTSGTSGAGGTDATCEPDATDEADIDPNAQQLELAEGGGLGPLGVTARAEPVLVNRDDAFAYRIFALNARNEFVYADIPIVIPDNFSAEWLRIGSVNDYFFSPPAVAAAAGRMWVFGVASDGYLYYSFQEAPYNGAWTEPATNGSGILSVGTWSVTDVELRDDTLSASATAFGNVLIAARCHDDRACIAVQPVEIMNGLSNFGFLHFDIESDFHPATIEAAIDPESGPKVHIAITGKDGTMHYGVGAEGADFLLREEDFEWTELTGMCFESAPTLVANSNGVDLFARGTDGAIYHRSLPGSDAFIKISPAVDTHPLVISDGNRALVVFAVPDGGTQGILRRFNGEGWTDWWEFADSSPFVNSVDRPFPGAALKFRSGVRLVVRDPNSELSEYSFAGVTR